MCFVLIQSTLRSRYFFCVMALMAQGAHRGRPVAAALCTPGLWPPKSPLRGSFDLSRKASGRAEAASVQNTALSPHPCGLPRPAGNVSAILRPPAPAVSARKVNKLTTGRTNVGRVRRQPPPGNIKGTVPDFLVRRRYACRGDGIKTGPLQCRYFYRYAIFLIREKRCRM